MLDLESWASGSILTGVTFCHWIFFHVVKPLISILPLLPINEKLDCHMLIVEFSQQTSHPGSTTGQGVFVPAQKELS